MVQTEASYFALVTALWYYGLLTRFGNTLATEGLPLLRAVPRDLTGLLKSNRTGSLATVTNSRQLATREHHSIRRLSVVCQPDRAFV
jgi:hypothetical protein